MNERTALPRKWQLMHLAEQSGWFFDDDKKWLWIKIHQQGDLALTIQQQYQFVTKFEESIFTLKPPVEIAVKSIGAPPLKNPELIYQADHAPKKTLSPAQQSDKLLFSLPLKESFRGRVEFYLQGLDARNQTVYSPTRWFEVDSDTTGPIFRDWVYPDSVWSDQVLNIKVKITDPAGVSRSAWGHGPFQIYWTINGITKHGYGEKIKNVFRDKNLNRHPKFRDGFFNFKIRPTHSKTSGPLKFYIEAWDYDKIPAKSRSKTHTIQVKARH